MKYRRSRWSGKRDLSSQLVEEKKPEKIWDKIIEGKLKKYFERSVYWIRNSSKIRISRWVRWSVI